MEAWSPMPRPVTAYAVVVNIHIKSYLAHTKKTTFCLNEMNIVLTIIADLKCNALCSLCKHICMRHVII